MSQGTVLVVDDELEIGALVQDILEDEGYQVLLATDAAQARVRCIEQKPDLVLLDIWMPDEDGISLLKDWFHSNEEFCPVIIMSGHGTIETAVEATRLGAYEFLEKPLSMSKLLLTVEHAIDSRSLSKNSDKGHQQTETIIEPGGKSLVMERLREQARKLARHETRILLTGEQGAGKETLARYIHGHSVRRSGPFVSVVLGAIAADQTVIEFFGWEDGDDIHQGLVEKADGGVLFLDGVDNMEEETQLRLFSALQSQSIMRVGGCKAVAVDVRVISSTRHNLEQQVQAGQFLANFYYLLNEVSISMPSLRDHNEDVSELLAYYVDYFVSREKMPIRRFSVASQNFLRHYPWHGNVRELKNLVQRLLILGAGDQIELDEVKAALNEETADRPYHVSTDLYQLSLKEAREQFEKDYLQYHLKRAEGSVARLSEAVGMERTHLYRKLHSLNIEFKKSSG
ncbi:MAG TPA: sigma-54-dependent Fis family transcriptional regulator [Crenotrichaceae bacterium]|nr:sigma-54-dependent Fis family transcriptional regulator [Crenotrichaceae bacterium]